ncbi:MAG: methyltransferase domain-containing protein [Deltaproteobacteria bacterium]|nr:methyltransferase domain-containing protein [Deltaproteobacteria bacterium]
MKLDAVPEGLVETVASLLGVVPSPVIRLLWSTVLPRMVVPAMRLGVFEAIAQDKHDPEDIARACDCHPEGMAMLLAGLNGFGFLKRRGGRYFLARDTARWIVASSPSSVRAAMEFSPVLDEMMAGMEDAIRTGQRKNMHETPHSPQFWKGYLEGLGAVARITGREIAARLRVGSPKRILDVGGGHGCYSVAFCTRFPDATAEVLDLPPAAEAGRAIVSRLGFSDRVGFREGDLRTTPWGDGHDVILLFNVMHNLPEALAQEAVHRAYSALAPGGSLVILDGDHAGKSGDLNAAEGFGELFFYAISSSKTWPEPTLRAWLKAAHFKEARKLRLFTFPNMLLLHARKGA